MNQEALVTCERLQQLERTVIRYRMRAASMAWPFRAGGAHDTSARRRSTARWPTTLRIARMTKTALLFGLWCLSGYEVAAQPVQRDAVLTTRIVEALREISTIEVGMTRRELSVLFGTEGGLSTALRRTYVYRRCPYIKVDVEFEPVGRPTRDSEGRVTLREADEDIIARVSRPYLAWSVMD